jgi:Rrf2 family nitric oxide-sensitive transcriptional repressor
MRLTTFTDYSLRVLIYVATRPGERTTIAAIAQAFDVSEHHLTKVVHFLGKCGWLSNARGRGGGLELAVAPGAINIGQVVRQTEGRDIPAECFEPGNNACTITRACRLKGVLEEAVKAFYGVLDRYTLEDLVQHRRPLEKMLFSPHPARESAKAGAR